MIAAICEHDSFEGMKSGLVVEGRPNRAGLRRASTTPSICLTRLWYRRLECGFWSQSSTHFQLHLRDKLFINPSPLTRRRIRGFPSGAFRTPLVARPALTMTLLGMRRPRWHSSSRTTTGLRHIAMLRTTLLRSVHVVLRTVLGNLRDWRIGHSSVH